MNMLEEWGDVESLVSARVTWPPLPRPTDPWEVSGNCGEVLAGQAGIEGECDTQLVGAFQFDWNKVILPAKAWLEQNSAVAHLHQLSPRGFNWVNTRWRTGRPRIVLWRQGSVMVGVHALWHLGDHWPVMYFFMVLTYAIWHLGICYFCNGCLNGFVGTIKVWLIVCFPCMQSSVKFLCLLPLDVIDL